MRAEAYFLRYAFPCSFILRQRLELRDEDVSFLEFAAVNHVPLSRLYLEKVYFRAFEKIGKLAQEMGADKWDLRVIQKYFRVQHNDVIDKGMYAYGEAPETLKNLCKIWEATVISVTDHVLTVMYDGNKKRLVMNNLVPDAQAGDLVTIHYGYAVEKILKDRLQSQSLLQ